jgi:hypothetical protein
MAVRSRRRTSALGRWQSSNGTGGRFAAFQMAGFGHDQWRIWSRIRPVALQGGRVDQDRRTEMYSTLTLEVSRLTDGSSLRI